MQIRVDNLHKGPRQVAFNEPVGAFPALVALAEQGEVVFRGKVAGQLEVSMAGGTVRVEGRATARAAVACSRCLTETERSLDVPLSFCYQKTEAVRGDEALPEEMELTLKEMELIPFQGEILDPAAEIAQEIIMALPQSALCREDCAGLCPVCGNDLNQQDCGCEKPVFHAGLARLKDLKLDRD